MRRVGMHQCDTSCLASSFGHPTQLYPCKRGERHSKRVVKGGERIALAHTSALLIAQSTGTGRMEGECPQHGEML
jgi:hypothetical protein